MTPDDILWGVLTNISRHNHYLAVIVEDGKAVRYTNFALYSRAWEWILQETNGTEPLEEKA